MNLMAIISNASMDETGRHIVLFCSRKMFFFQNSPGLKFFSTSGTSLSTLLGDMFFCGF
jgi:hypothetical protein